MHEKKIKDNSIVLHSQFSPYLSLQLQGTMSTLFLQILDFISLYITHPNANNTHKSIFSYGTYPEIKLPYVKKKNY